MSRRPPIFALAALAAAAALFAGCGGSGSGQKANDTYASGVCTAVGNWLTKVKGVDAVHSLSGITEHSVDARLGHFERATRQLVSQLDSLPPPHTSEGGGAKGEIHRLVVGADGEIASAQTVESTLAANGSMAQVAGALAALPDFQALRATAQSTITALQSSGGSLASAFKSEPACKQVG